MRQSIRDGRPLPENEVEFLQLIARNSSGLSMQCWNCRNIFSADNTHSPAGWRDTQIAKICENCFDDLHSDGDENPL